MRVLAMLHRYTPHHNAGAEMMVHAMFRALVERGHQVDVLLSLAHRDVPGPYEIDGVRVFPPQGKGDPFMWVRNPDRKPHVMVSHLENTDRASILAAQHGIPAVHVLHNTFDQTKWSLERGRPRMVVYNTQWMRADYEDWWSATVGSRPMPWGLVVRPPVDPGEYATTPGDRVTLINICKDKGSRTFWELAKRFPRQGFLGVRGAYGVPEVRDARENPNVELTDHIPGQRMREKVYARTKVLLVPSVYESYGRVAAEAICSGIPVIAHPTPGLRESLGDAGTFVHRDDLDGWGQALKRLLSPRGWSAASKRALIRAKELDPEAELDRWVRAMEVVAGVVPAR